MKWKDYIASNFNASNKFFVLSGGVYAHDEDETTAGVFIEGADIESIDNYLETPENIIASKGKYLKYI
jgi:hypothetical protein